jgi:hypothetical protein
LSFIKIYDQRPTEQGNYEVRIEDLHSSYRIDVAYWNGFKFDLKTNRQSHTEYVIEWKEGLL